MAGHVPRYVSPQERAENRARIRRWLFWTAVAFPVLFAVFFFGYSDQAPAFLRNFIVAFDRSLGFPIISLLQWVTAR